MIWLVGGNPFKGFSYDLASFSDGKVKSQAEIVESDLSTKEREKPVCTFYRVGNLKSVLKRKKLKDGKDVALPERIVLFRGKHMLQKCGSNLKMKSYPHSWELYEPLRYFAEEIDAEFEYVKKGDGRLTVFELLVCFFVLYLIKGVYR